ncbi:hypothetical protein DV515_00015900 [Chloebia gouldiae]|uniref:Uncharacterized protein n=1 Tax=Chloebia gouldiae TaxID=44316 RepID=A0A3L8RVA3_CHLGU|nr:hypothetical protein DV515_00015900 [Chloebia gouldiae]
MEKEGKYHPLRPGFSKAGASQDSEFCKPPELEPGQRAAAGNGKLLCPHIPPNTATTQHKHSQNIPTQTMRKVTLHFGRERAQMDPLSPKCPKQK